MSNKHHIVAITAFIRSKCGNKFLVIKRHQNEIAYPGKWTFPGGKMEREENVLGALKREVLEEVGLDIEDEKNMIEDFTFIRPDGHNVIGFTFEVNAKHEEVKIPEDFQEFKWVTPDEFMKLDFIEGMENAVKRAFR